MNEQQKQTVGKPVSLATVAQRAGVSVATVSRIVNGELRRASPKTVMRVQAVVRDLGYRPNHVGRSLRRGASRIVAMLAPNIDNPAMAAIAASTEAALRDAGYVMILCDTHDQPDLQDEYLHAMRSQFAQGYVMVSAVPSPELKTAVERGEPIVFVSRRSPFGSGAYVGIDNRKAGADAADHFWSLGLKAPAMIRPHLLSTTIADRTEGFLDRMVQLGADRSRMRIAEGSGLSHLASGYDAACRLVAAGGWPDALMCPSDLMAYGTYRLATETGVPIPAQCRVIGIDDNELNGWIAPWLTSIRIPYRAFGARVVEELTALWRGVEPRQHLLPHALVQRA
jgi:LacI family transcriptional regulator